jgi:UDP-2,3-diacylglucosamine pyrophosphatase LpxH
MSSYPRLKFTKFTTFTPSSMSRHPKHNWKLVVVANDFHIPFHDEAALALFRRFLREEKPKWLILNGDVHDFWEISRFDLTPRIGQDFRDEIALGKAILRDFRRLLPRTRITWIEGNHEFRLRRYLIQNARELYGVPGLSVPELFDLKRLKIDYVACHPAASRFIDNFIRVGNLYVGHWDKVAMHGGYAAKGLVENKGVSILQGHTHRFGAHARTTVDGRVLVGIENFSMCRRQASYVANPNWQLGFSVVYLEPVSGRFHWYPIEIRDRGFVWKGKEYWV